MHYLSPTDATDREIDAACDGGERNVTTITAAGQAQLTALIDQMQTEQRPLWNSQILTELLAVRGQLNAGDVFCQWQGTTVAYAQGGRLWWTCPLCGFAHDEIDERPDHD